MQEENNKEKNIDIKGTLAKFVVADEPEMSQEEAIMKYEESKKKKNLAGASGEETTEEEEHLKRVKKELLASLERVKELAKKIYGEKAEINKMKKLKVNNGKSSSKNKELQKNEQQKDSNENNQIKERE